MKTIADYDREISQNPNDAEAYNDRGITHRNNGNYEQAISDLTKSIQINPNNIEPYYNRGLAYMNIKEVSKAFDDYNKVIQIDPKNAEAYAKRGSINLELENIQEAISDFEEFLKLDPNNKNAKLVRDELEKLKSEDDEDCFEVSEAKKEIKIINICSIVCGIIGTVIGISILSGGYNGSEAFEILISVIWVGIGIGGGISSLIQIPDFFASVYRREGFKEACKIVLGGGAFFFVLFMFAGPLGWLIRVIKRKNIIKKFN